MKKGLDYFPLDCVLDDSVRLAEAELGLEGFAVLIKLWQDIYRGEGYYKNFDGDVLLLFSKEQHIGEEKLKKFIKVFLDRGIFHKGLYDKYKILTSKEIQERFLKCTKKRKTKNLKEEFLLIGEENGSFFKENDVKNEENDGKSEENSSRFKQSKVKESKVKESKGEENISPPAGENNITGSFLKTYGEYENVRLTDAQYENLLAKMGEAELKRYIKKVDEYVKETGKVYKDTYLTIRRWHTEDKEKEKEKEKQSIMQKGPPFIRRGGALNYEDTAKPDYKKVTEKILRDMLGE